MALPTELPSTTLITTAEGILTMSLDYLVKAARLFGLAGMMLGSYSCSEEEAAVASAGCVRDTDCKGERVCVEGECVSDGERQQGGEGEGRVSRIAVACGHCKDEPPIADLYLINPDGTGLTRLTEGDCSRSPRWSPDGRYIVYESWKNGISIFNVQDLSIRPVRNLPEYCESPDWSSDNRIVMSCGDCKEEPFDRNLYLVNPDGTGLTQLTEGVGCDDTPSWSPDSKNIVYDSRETGVSILNMQDLSVRPIRNLPQYCGEPAWSL